MKEKRSGLEALSERELQIATLIANGNSQKTVSRKLDIAISTVANHCVRVYRKLDIGRKEQLIDLMRAHQRVVPIAKLKEWLGFVEPGGRVHRDLDQLIKAAA